MMTRLLLDADRLLKTAKRKLEWRKRVVVPNDVWDALMDAERAIMVLSSELHVESGRVMAMVPPKKGDRPLNPMAMVWAGKLDRIEMTLTRAIFAVRREHPKTEAETAAEAAELEEELVRALH